MLFRSGKGDEMTPSAIERHKDSMRDVLLICDLDGTLVDSYSGIKAALQEALSAVDCSAAEPLDRWIVGPPLDELLRRAVGLTNPTTLAKARQVFVEFYDHAACKQSEPFCGVKDMLDNLMDRGVKLGLATNKRVKPTNAILKANGWQSIFIDVQAVDSKAGHARTKSEMLEDILRRNASAASSSFYLGDTLADAVAAEEVSVPFVLAAWGATPLSKAGASFVAASPGAVLPYLANASRAFRDVRQAGLSP